MKKLQFILACAALTALSSCSSDDQSFDPNEIRITTNVGGIEATTRAAANTYDDGYFDANSQINIYIFEHVENGETEAYKYGTDGLLAYIADGSGNLSTTTKPYYPANGHNIDVYGIYSGNQNIKFANSQTITVSEDQSNDANYKASDLMWASKTNHAKSENAVALSFNHKLSKVIVELKEGDGLNNGDLANATVQILNTSTNATINVDRTGINNLTPSTTTEDIKPITLGCWNAGNNVAAIIIPQQVGAGKQLFKVTLSNQAEYIYTIPTTASPVTFEADKKYTYTLTLTTKGIEVTATIKDWSQNDSKTGDAILD